jgi:hypothetical protein
MTNNAKHTPTPWNYGPSIRKEDFTDIISKDDERLIFSVRDNANAVFIVRAVNSHEALLEACKEAITLCVAYQFKAKVFQNTLDVLEKAIAKTEGK